MILLGAKWFSGIRPLLREGEFKVSKELVTKIPGIGRSLCLYYFFTLKWFKGEMLERKIRQNKMPIVQPCYVSTPKREQALL